MRKTVSASITRFTRKRFERRRLILYGTFVGCWPRFEPVRAELTTSYDSLLTYSR
jgi:hypothetical protein